ncbi:hypothetical protein FACS1894211_07640 [Clostridia bacterium]|nr:hypothetical protein FACS1894211_07640 [Clostridia bacterium]
MDIRALPENRFSCRDFEKPEAFLGPCMLWFWHGALKSDELSAVLADLKRAGVQSVWALPVPADFRPNHMKTELEPEFLSDAYGEAFRKYAESADGLDMRVWLYDDGGWPSGSACGRVVRENPELAAETLGRVCVKSGESLPSAEGFKDRVLYHTVAADGSATYYLARKRVPPFHAEGVYPHLYPDLLNPRAAKKFLELSHGFYKKHMSAYFGHAIPLVFTDEPGVLPPPWTPDLEESFREAFGYGITEKIPDLFSEDAAGARTRIDYYDWWSGRFCRAFLSSLGDWCAGEGLLSAGHFGGDDETDGARKYGYGHILRALRTLDIPGVDAIWRQVFPGDAKKLKIAVPGSGACEFEVAGNRNFPKFASSVAHQKGSRYALTESFAVYGAGLTFAQMRWITHFQYVRGINLMAAACVQHGMKDYDRVRQRPIFGPQNPMWESFPPYAAYTARLGYLLSLGVPCISAAVYYPVRDIWAGGEASDKAARSYDALTKTLFDLRCDFDVIDDDLLSVPSAAEGGMLAAGPMRYDTVYIGGTEYMSGAARDALRRFADAGGRVVRASDGGGWTESVLPTVDILPADVPVKACKRRIGEDELFFLVNEGTESCACALRVYSGKQAWLLDPETASAYRVGEQFRNGGRWEIPLQFAFADGKTLYFTDENLGKEVYRTREPAKKFFELASGWSVSAVKKYLIGPRVFETGECASAYAPAALGDWSGYFGADFSGEASYKTGFNCSAEDAAVASELDLGDVRHTCGVTLNGVPLGKKVWPPYVFDIRGKVRAGANELTVSVVNTFANQFAHTDSFSQYGVKELSNYHYIALGFEADSLSGGLLGPVKIVLDID